MGRKTNLGSLLGRRGLRGRCKRKRKEIIVLDLKKKGEFYGEEN